MSNWLNRLGRFVAIRRWLVVAGWIVIAVAIVMADRVGGGGTVDNFEVPGVESQQAVDLLKDQFPERAGATAMVVFHATDGPLTDGSTADLGREALDALFASAGPAEAAGVQIEYGGELPTVLKERTTGPAEMIGIVAALTILFVTFRIVYSAILPLGVAILGLIVGLSIVGLLGVIIGIPSVAPRLGTMIGLGVGIDYALFILSRHRYNLEAGVDSIESIGRTNATAGKPSWLLAAPWWSPSSATSWPASRSSPRSATRPRSRSRWRSSWPSRCCRRSWRSPGPASWRDPPGCRREGGSPPDRRAGGDRRRAQRLGAMGSLGGVPSLAVRDRRHGRGADAGDPGARHASRPGRRRHRPHLDHPSPRLRPPRRRVRCRVNGPLLLTVDLGASGDQAVLDSITATVGSDPGVQAVSPAEVNAAGTTALITAIPTTKPQDQATSDLVHHLRDTTLPDAIAGMDAAALVGGPTAGFIDQSDKISARLPWFIGAVVTLSFLLLMTVFRSILVPLKAALLNLLSIGAAYGVVVAVFQWGWGRSLIGLDEAVPIAPFVPMMMFAILFGLSMDYEVFILSRIREEYHRGHSNIDSVVEGLGATAKVITAAALIMISVFLGFVASDDPVVKMMGVGLATAVAVDATIVRMVLVPSTMALVGDPNWWLPGWLDRILPHLDIEGEALGSVTVAATEPPTELPTELPAGLVLVRTTPVFDNDSVPAGLLNSHQVADGVWGRLVVHTGSVGFVFDDDPDQEIAIDAGGHVVIPPTRLHHVLLDGPATFAVEFYREPTDTSSELESTGLEPPDPL